MSAEQEHGYIRTFAALVVAVALFIGAWSAYRIAKAAEEQACWAEISATADTDRAVVDFMERSGVGARKEMWTERQTAYREMRRMCEPL